MTTQPRLARRWARVAGLFVAVGAVSGTVLSFEMGLLWPGLMGRFGDVIGHLAPTKPTPTSPKPLPPMATPMITI